MTLRGMRANRGRSYADLDRVAAVVRRTIAPRVAVDAPIPGCSLFEGMSAFTIRFEGRSVPITYEAKELPSGIEALAWYSVDEERLVLTLDGKTYEDLEDEVPRARFSLAHEIGHLVLHSAELVQLARTSVPIAAALKRSRNHEIFRDTEWQADNFAARLLMPVEGMNILKRSGRLSSAVVQATFEVSAQAAGHRIDFLARKDSR